MVEVSSWKQDAEGWYLEMLAGARKDYSIDAVELSGGQDIASFVLDVPAGLTLVGNPEINAKVVKFWLHANGGAGLFACEAEITGNGNPAFTEIFPFCVIVR